MFQSEPGLVVSTSLEFLDKHVECSYISGVLIIASPPRSPPCYSLHLKIVQMPVIQLTFLQHFCLASRTISTYCICWLAYLVLVPRGAVEHVCIYSIYSYNL
jgi:hypothetical protein